MAGQVSLLVAIRQKLRAIDTTNPALGA
jgi:hypothetical protein